MKDVLRKCRVYAASLVALGALLGASVARAEEEPLGGPLEVGLFGGAHLFAKDMELGVADYPDLVPAPRNSWLLGARVAYALGSRWSVEGELAAIPTSDTLAGRPVFVLGWRAHGLFHLLDTGRWRPFLVAGVGSLSSFTGRTGLNEIGDDSDFTLHWGAGLKYDVTPQLSLRADFRHLLPPSTRGEGLTNDFEFHAGLAYRFGAPPAAPPPPPAPKDTDGDGLLDDADRCPSEAEDKDGFQDEDGCLDGDNDSDGVPDTADRCGAQAETVNGVDDEDGCPEVDEDGDGLLGSKDTCPAQAEDKDGFEDEDGCPDTDNDKDGVADAADKCQGEQETRNGFQDEDGCADELPKTVQRFTGVIAGLRFKTGSDTIQPQSYKQLDEAAAVLRQFPGLRLEISGHTSSEGEAQLNLELSRRRAESVRRYLLSKGVEPDRLTAVGLGSTRPLDTNDTKAGREKNRRIEFRVLSDVPAEAPTQP